MANSLQEQLLKAGLADKKKANRAKQAKREDANRAKRGEIDLEDPAERARRQRAEKVEKDRQLEAARQAERQDKEIAAQVRQLIESHRLARGNGEEPFQFVQERKIKKLYVTPAQRDQLTRGQIAVVALGDSQELVPTAIAEKIRQRDAAAVLLLNERGASQEGDEDDPYADYPIPDDLMW
ncbi:DUF2058 domain-containing protein [Alloalcanivorax mobilis]|uniref:DUF2058 domain-containing protein n=1 Tax=Alloalcanivorax mobilis TaxID=2019569 RepID=UPI000B5B3AAA|nr:DUF2058 domain-containing protein [Alloalcanivorax mobilis]ASK35453.1 nucleoprotein/polynucleotide-associated enzyme [Alcanivorax sp. N3-2A]|tara:strand:- start:3246 stop:3788 length:543 start_codon:yes stop_codon:yes gene_type:complete